MGGRVLVTRPQPGADRAIRQLTDAGFEAVLLPLTEIVPLAVRSLPGAAQMDAVVATSANGLKHTPPALIAALAARPLFAVGKATATAAVEKGFSHVVAGSGAGDALATLVADRLGAGCRVLYLCGKVRHPDFEEALTAAGLVVEAVETYDTVARPLDTATVRDALSDRPIDAVLVFSALAAAAVSTVVGQTELAEFFKTTRFIAISARAAAALKGIERARIAVAHRAEAAAMLSLLGIER